MSNLELWEKVERRVWDNVTPEPNSGCWLWAGYVHKNGYATMKLTSGGKAIMAHRASYIVRHGQIPNNLPLDHKCKVKSCVNPDHLEPVTYAENNRRSPRTITLKSHCKHGHPFSGENTRWDGKQRRCMECDRRVALASYHRRKNVQS
jgi:hypothetical protein